MRNHQTQYGKTEIRYFNNNLYEKYDIGKGFSRFIRLDTQETTKPEPKKEDEKMGELYIKRNSHLKNSDVFILMKEKKHSYLKPEKFFYSISHYVISNSKLSKEYQAGEVYDIFSLERDKIKDLTRNSKRDFPKDSFNKKLDAKKYFEKCQSFVIPNVVVPNAFSFGQGR